MCLIVKKGCKPRVAKKDILCYKVVRFDNGHSWVSPYMVSKQAYNKVLKAKDPLDFSPITSLIIGRWGHVGYGFHAWTNEAMAWGDMCAFNRSRRKNIYAIRLAIIPAGAEYCYGANGDIVATQMIVFGSDKAYWKYLAAKK